MLKRFLHRSLLLTPDAADGGGAPPAAAPTPAPAAPSSPSPAPAPRQNPEMAKIIETARRHLPNSVLPLPEKQIAPPVAPAPPAEPVTPTPPVAPAPPAEPAAPKKITVAGKEYTEEQLAELLKPAPPAAPTPAPAPQQAPAAQPQAPAMTPEQAKRMEAAWISNFAPNVTPTISPDEMEAILAGDANSPKAFAAFLARNNADVAMKTRGSMFQEINPAYDGLVARLESQQAIIDQLANHHQQLQQTTQEQMFLSKHPEFKEHVDIARHFARELREKHGAWVNQVGEEAFLAEVAKQADAHVEQEFRRWNKDPNVSWKTFGKTPPVQAAPTPPPPPTLRPPAPNAPSGQPLPSAKAKSPDQALNEFMRST